MIAANMLKKNSHLLYSEVSFTPLIFNLYNKFIRYELQ